MPTNSQGLTSQGMGQLAEDQMKDRVISDSQQNPGKLAVGAQMGTVQTGTEPQPVTFQAYTQPDAAPVDTTKSVSTITSKPAEAYVEGLGTQVKTKEQELMDMSKNINKNPANLTPDQQGNLDYYKRTTGQNPDYSNASMREIMPNEADLANRAGKIKDQTDRAKLLASETDLQQSGTANAAAFRSGQAGSSYGKASLERMQNEQDYQQQQFKKQELDALRGAWSSAQSGRIEDAQRLQKEAQTAADESTKAAAEALKNRKDALDVEKLGEDRADATIDRATKSGIKLSDGQLDYIDQKYGLDSGTSRQLYEVSRIDQKQVDAKDFEERQSNAIEGATKLQTLLEKVPIGTEVKIGNQTYTGLSRGDIKTGTETDENGNVTFWEYNQNSNKVSTTSLGNIGTAKDGWEVKDLGDQGIWRVNPKTGQSLPFFATQSQKDWQGVVPEGSVSPFKDANGNSRTQCGAWVNDICGAGVGDTFQSKMEKTDKTIKFDGENPPRTGDFFVQSLGTWTGHVGMVADTRQNPTTGEWQVLANESNYPQPGKVTTSRWVNAKDIAGFGRTGKLNPIFQTGPDSLHTTGSGVEGGAPSILGAGRKPADQEKPLSADEIAKYGLDPTDPKNVGLTLSGVKDQLKAGNGKADQAQIEVPSFEEAAPEIYKEALKDANFDPTNQDQLHAIYDSTIGARPNYMDAAQNLSYKLTDKKTPLVIADIKKAVENDDYAGAQDKLKKLALDTADTTTAQQIRGRDNSLRALENIQNDLNDFVAKNGNTGLLSGSEEEVKKKLGQVGNPELRKIATKIQAAIIDYRHAVSGAGFTASEAQQYNDMFPAITNSSALNESNIDALKSVFQQGNESFYRQQLGNQNYDVIFGQD